MTVRAPMLLDSQMREIRRLEPASLSLTLNGEPPSTADMTLALDRENPIPMRAWIRLYTIHGDAGIYRVSASDTEYDTMQQRLTLEHGITSLRDTVIPSIEDIEEESEISESAVDMLSSLIGRQNNPIWQAGTCAASETVILDQNGRTLFDMLLDMMDQLPEYDLSLDQSSFPWTVSIVEKAKVVTAEGRLSRNLGSVRVTYDDSELCTRVYMPGLENGYMDADTQGIYGIVEASYYLSSETERGEAERIAERYLMKRKEPAISVELDAVDLSEATGETIDAFTVGKKFRLTIPAYGVIVDQWITGLAYADVYGDPDHVTVTLGNRIADISQRAAKTKTEAQNAARSASGAGSGGVRATTTVIAKELRDHDEYITALEDGINVFRIDDASVTVDQAIVKLFAQQRDLYTGGKDAIMETLRQAGVTVDASKSLVELFASMATTYDGRIDTAESRITVNADNIELKVSKNGVISSINQTAETIKIQASRINLEGYVTADNLYSTIAAMTSVSARNLTVSGELWVMGSSSSSRAEWQSTNVVSTVDLANSVVKKRTLYYLGMNPSSEWTV